MQSTTKELALKLKLSLLLARLNQRAIFLRQQRYFLSVISHFQVLDLQNFSPTGAAQ